MTQYHGIPVCEIVPWKIRLGYSLSVSATKYLLEINGCGIE